MPYLTDLAAVAAKTNLEVIEVSGWQTQGRGEMSDVRAVVCHHTATLNRTADMPSLDTLVNGRPDLSGPLAHFGLSRSGKVYVVAEVFSADVAVGTEARFVPATRREVIDAVTRRPSRVGDLFRAL